MGDCHHKAAIGIRLERYTGRNCKIKCASIFSDLHTLFYNLKTILTRLNRFFYIFFCFGLTSIVTLQNFQKTFENILTKSPPEYKILSVNIRQKATVLDKSFTEKVIEKEQYFPQKLEILVIASKDIITISPTKADDLTERPADKCFGGKIYWDD